MFKLRTIAHQDDLRRHQRGDLPRIAKAQEGDPHFLPLPDLILLDGGPGPRVEPFSHVWGA
jgi:hypothetical protein